MVSRLVAGGVAGGLFGGEPFAVLFPAPTAGFGGPSGAGRPLRVDRQTGSLSPVGVAAWHELQLYGD